MQTVNISPPWYAYTCPASSIARGVGGTPTICNVAFLCFFKVDNYTAPSSSQHCLPSQKCKQLTMSHQNLAEERCCTLQF